MKIIFTSQFYILTIYTLIYIFLNMYTYNIDFLITIKGVLFVLFLSIIGGKILFKYIPEELGVFALLTSGFILSSSISFFISFLLFHFISSGLSYDIIFYINIFILITLALLIDRKGTKSYIVYLFLEEKKYYIASTIILILFAFTYSIAFYYGKANILSNIEFSISILNWANQGDMQMHFTRNIDNILMGLPLEKVKHMFEYFIAINYAFWSFKDVTLATSIVSLKMLLPMFVFTILYWLHLLYKVVFKIKYALLWTLLTPFFAPITLNIIDFNPLNSRFSMSSWNLLYHSDTQLLTLAPILISLFFLFQALQKNNKVSFILFSIFLFISFFVKPSGYVVIFPSVLIVLLIFRKNYSMSYLIGIAILLIPPIYWKLYSHSMEIITNTNKIKLEFAFFEMKIKALERLWPYEELSFVLAVLIILLSSFLFIVPILFHLIKRKTYDFKALDIFVISVILIGIIPPMMFNTRVSNLGWIAGISITILIPFTIQYVQNTFTPIWKKVFYFIMFLHFYSGIKFGYYFITNVR